MPTGIAGLLVAAILAAAMSNLSAALNSLSSTTVVDFYMGWRPQANDRERMLVSRASTVLWALVLFAVAVYAVHAGGKGNVVEIGLSIASVAYGCLLGVFLLGTLTRYATQGGAIVGMVTGFALNLALWQCETASAVHIGRQSRIPHVAWTWYVLIGALVTFAVGSLASLVFRRRARKARSPLLFAACHPLGSHTPTHTRRPRDGTCISPPPTHPTPTAPTSPPSPPPSTPPSRRRSSPARSSSSATAARSSSSRPTASANSPANRVSTASPPPAEPMTLDTIFDMASMTKVLVTSDRRHATLRGGQARLRRPRSQVPARVLPPTANRPSPSANSSPTTPASRPTSTSKTPGASPLPTRPKASAAPWTSPLTTTPGTHFEYSDINYIVLGALVEKLSGHPLDVYAQQHIFTPLGMKTTTLSPFYCSPCMSLCHDDHPATRSAA